MEEQDETARALAVFGPSKPKGRATAQDWFGEAQPTDVGDDRSMRLESPVASSERRGSLGAGAHPGSAGPLGGPGGYLKDESPTVQSPHESLPPDDPVSYRPPPSGPRNTAYTHDGNYRDQHWQRRGTYSGPMPNVRGSRWNDTQMGSHGNPSRYFSNPAEEPRNDGRGSHRGRGRPYPLSPQYIVPKGAINWPQSPATDTNAASDPRLPHRMDTTPRIDPERQQDAPPAATENEQDGPSAVPPSLRSGNQTPQSPAAMTPGEDRIESLTSVLDEFTTHVTKIASITMQRDTARSELAKREQDLHNSRKYHAAFPTLAERHVNGKARAQKRFEELDRQLGEHVHTREKLSKAIASRLLSQTNPKEPKTVRRVDDALEEMSKQMHEFRSACGQMTALQSRFDGFRVELTRLHSQYKDVEAGLAVIRSHLIPRLEQLERRLSDSPDFKVEVSSIRDELERLSRSGEKASSTVRELHESIYNKEDGLADVVTDRLKRHEGNFKKLNEDLDRLFADIDQLEGRIKAKEEHGRGNVEETTNSASRVDSGFAVESEAVAAVKVELEAFRNQQLLRDDLFGETIETTEKTANKVQSDLSELRRSFESTVKRAEERMSKLERMVSEEKGRVGNAAPQPTAQADAPDHGAGINAQWIQATKEVHDHVKKQQKALSQLGQLFGTLKYTVENLDSRFNKLTTEELARYILRQLSEVFPHASSIQTSFDQVKQQSEGIQTRMEELTSKVEQLSIERQPAPPETIDTEQKHQPEKQTYSQEEMDNKLAGLRASIYEVIQLHQEASSQAKKLEAEIQTIGKSSSREFALLHVQVANLNKINNMHISQAGGDAGGSGQGTAAEARAVGESGGGISADRDHGAPHKPRASEPQASAPGPPEEDASQAESRKRKREEETKSRRSSRVTTYVVDSDESETVLTPRRRSKRNRRRAYLDPDPDNEGDKTLNRRASRGLPARRARRPPPRDWIDDEEEEEEEEEAKEDVNEWVDEQLAG